MASTSFFDGIPADELQAVLDELPRRSYPAGATVIAEGETLREICLAEAGSADVFVSDRHGAEHLVGHAGPGTTLGEMSLFTGQPAVATVRAAEELDVVVLGEADFEQLCSAFPQIYRNLGAILSERLAHTDRLVAREEPGRLVFVEDDGRSAVLAYALACSISWHTRASTLLLVVAESPAEALVALARGSDHEGAALEIESPTGPYAPGALGRAAEELCARYEHVIVWATPPDGAAAVNLSEPGLPTLERVDEDALRSGRLPPSTVAGKALGRIARGLTGLTVGVALGAGSVRGFAHWGVLEALEEMGVPVDYLAGSSVGGAVSAFYACGLRGQDGMEVSLKTASTLFRPTIPTKGILSSRALARHLHDTFGDALIEDGDPPFAVVTTDIRSRRSVVLRRGRVDKAVLATLSIPGIYPAQRSGAYVLVDGGVLDPIPIGVAADMGANVVIGVRLLGRPNPDDVDARIEDESSARQPSTLATIMRSIEIMQTRVSPEPVDATTILITPELKNIPSMKLRNLAQGVRFVGSGAEEARSARPRLAAALPWLRV